MRDEKGKQWRNRPLPLKMEDVVVTKEIHSELLNLMDKEWHNDKMENLPHKKLVFPFRQHLLIK